MNELILKRCQEIEQYISSDEMDRSTSRLMDFCYEFGDREHEKTALIIKREFSQIKNEYIKFGSDPEYSRKMAHLSDKCLRLLDEIKDLRSFVGGTKKAQTHSAFESELSNQANQPFRDTILTATEIEIKYGAFKLEIPFLKILEGEIIGVVGQNGSGKSTLVKVLSKRMLTQSGDLVYNIDEFETKNNEEFRRVVHYLPQDIPTKTNITVTTYLRYVFAINGILGSDNISLTEKVIYRLGLENFAEFECQELSGGYRLRLELAIIFGLRPKLIYLDEPLANLDVITQVKVLHDIMDLAHSTNHRCTVIVTSQHLYEIEEIANRIIYLENGSPLFIGSGDELWDTDGYSYLEFSIDLPYNTLTELFSSFTPDFLLSQNRFKYVLQVNKSVDIGKVTTALIAQSSNLKYYRNISKSVKRFFKDAII